jgi:hypothetical protein
VREQQLLPLPLDVLVAGWLEELATFRLMLLPSCFKNKVKQRASDQIPIHSPSYQLCGKRGCVFFPSNKSLGVTD